MLAEDAAEASATTRLLLQSKLDQTEAELTDIAEKEGWTDDQLRNKLLDAEIAAEQEAIAAEQRAKKSSNWKRKIINIQLAAKEAELEAQAEREGWSPEEFL